MILAAMEAENGVGEQSAPEDRLLEGENPKTSFVDDAVHWINVYSELLEYKGDILERTLAEQSTADPAAGRELAKTDQAFIEEEAARFQRRLEFWRQRYKELAGDDDAAPHGALPA